MERELPASANRTYERQGSDLAPTIPIKQLRGHANGAKPGILYNVAYDPELEGFIAVSEATDQVS